MGYSVIIGIDPGATGAVASVFYEGSYDSCKLVKIEYVDTNNEAYVYEYLRKIDTDHSIDNILIEEIHVFRTDNIGIMSKVATLLVNYEKLLFSTHVLKLGMLTDTVKPRKWQEVFGLHKLKKKDFSVTQIKTCHKLVAQALVLKFFKTKVEQKVTLKNVDAILIAFAELYWQGIVRLKDMFSYDEQKKCITNNLYL